MEFQFVNSSCCSPEDEAGPRAHGPGGALGARVEHDAPHVRARAVAAAARRAARLARQRALRARSHEVRHRRTDRIRHAKPESIREFTADFYINCRLFVPRFARGNRKVK